MHCIFSPIGSAGDVNPMLGIAAALHGRGHDVSFVANGYFRESVERAGLQFVELGTRELFHAIANHPNLWKPHRAFSYVFHQAVLPILRGQYAVIEALRRPGESVVVANCLGFGARIAQEKLGVPLVTLHVQPAVLLSRTAPPEFSGVTVPPWLRWRLFELAQRLVIDRVVCPEVNRFRGELGLPPMRKTMRWWHSPQCVLCAFPEWFALAQRDWPPQCVQTDFPLWDGADDRQPLGEVEEFLDAGAPPIVFAPGSANVFAAPFFAAAVERVHTASAARHSSDAIPGTDSQSFAARGATFRLRAL